MSNTKGTQSWLAGEDDRLESFFSSRSSTRSEASMKRKRTSSRGQSQVGPSGSTRNRAGSNKAGVAVKEQTLLDKTLVRRVGKSKLASRPSAMPTPSSPKKRPRSALANVTAHQNSPRRRPGAHAPQPSSLLEPRSPSASPTQRNLRRLLRMPALRGSKSAPLNLKRQRIAQPEDGDDELIERTPSPSPTRKCHGSNTVLPSPPSTAGPERLIHRTPSGMDRDTSGPYATPSLASFGKQSSSLAFEGTRTPLPALFASASSGKPQSRTAFPTPDSLAVPRLRRLDKQELKRVPAPLLGDISFKRPKDPSLSVIVVEDSEGESDLILRKPHVPSSQTQYLHYSPTKQHTRQLSPQKLRARIFASELLEGDGKGKGRATDVVPSSQAELVPDSPRKVQIRKPTPIVTMPTKERNVGIQSTGHVVPTSQEDEKELELLKRGSLPDTEAIMSLKENIRFPAASEVEQPADTPTSLSPITPLSTSSKLPSTPLEGYSRETIASLDYRASSSRSQEIISDSQEQPTRDFYASASPSSQTEPDSSQPSFFVPESPTKRHSASAGVSGLRGPTMHRRRTQAGTNEDGFQIPASPLIPSSQTQPETFELADIDHTERIPLSQKLRNGTLPLQSSMTEPDFSQWNQDPFGEENEGFQRFSGRMAPDIDASETRTVDTQGSTTQSDNADDETVLGLIELPLSLPYPKQPSNRSLSASTIERDVIEESLIVQSQTLPLDLPEFKWTGHSGDPTEEDVPEGCTYTSSPMPDIGSEGSEPIIFTPRRAHRTVAAVRHALDVSTDENGSRVRDQKVGDRKGGVDWEGVKAVQDFFGMFSPSQSQDENM